jgi:primosomal protein N' (replication factor Y)
VTLVGVISGDTALALPGLPRRRAHVPAHHAGRRPRGPRRLRRPRGAPDVPARRPAIQAAIRQDFVGFAKDELAHRREVGLPPFARMVRIVLRDEEPSACTSESEDLAALLDEPSRARRRGP